MIVSVETPVFKGGWLQACIDSVLYQSSPNWHLSLLWDGGDEQSRRILERVERTGHPNVSVYFEENRGIARARRFLTEHSEGELILPLDDDDALPFHAVERLLEVASAKPWASVIRGRRKFIDLSGRVVEAEQWFPFAPRSYQNGMVTDLFNHSQPYLIRRSAYDRTTGWEGFEDFSYAGEDCDIYLKLEERGTVELVDEVLYYYRIHGDRASLVLTDEAAFEMWRRLADKTIERIGLPLTRRNQRLPFLYDRVPRPAPDLSMLDFAIATADADRAAGERLARSLQDGGVAADAIRSIERGDVGDLDRALSVGERPIVCIVDASVDATDTADLERLLAALHACDADLVAPRLVAEDGAVLVANPGFTPERLPETGGDAARAEPRGRAPWLPETLVVVRREVARAVGGLDTGYRHARMAMADFCLRARQRDFACAFAGDVAFTCRPGPDADPGGDARRLRAKWEGYPQLFEPPARTAPVGRTSETSQGAAG